SGQRAGYMHVSDDSQLPVLFAGMGAEPRRIPRALRQRRILAKRHRAPGRSRFYAWRVVAVSETSPLGPGLRDSFGLVLIKRNQDQNDRTDRSQRDRERPGTAGDGEWSDRRRSRDSRRQRIFNRRALGRS